MTEHKPSPRKILFAPAAGPGVGGGHVTRCLTLGEALAARGADYAFVVNETAADLVKRFGGDAVETYRGALRSVLEAEAFDALIIDDYAVSADQERPLRDLVHSLVVIDDLADRPHAANLLIDSGYGRETADYDGLLPQRAKRLVGPTYALVKSAFAERRSKALSRQIALKPQRLFVSFGLSDIGGVTDRAIRIIRERYADVHIDVALASDAHSGPDLGIRAMRDPNLHLHFDAENVAELMASADLAIGAGGASTWERCCLGLPTLAVIVADNQRPTIRRLAEDGMLKAVDVESETFETEFVDALTALQAPMLREDLGRRTSSLCDGLGADRAAVAILSL